MIRQVCLDTSVIIGFLVPEPDQGKARMLLQAVESSHGLIFLPSFAWTEVGSVLLKKVKHDQMKAERLAETWSLFRALPMIRYLEADEVVDRAWNIAARLGLHTLYDAAFLAVAEYVADWTGDVCEFWTADRHLVSIVGGQLDYVRSLASMPLPASLS